MVNHSHGPLDNDGEETRKWRMISVEDSGEALLELLAANKVKYLFFNSGSDIHPIMEHLSKFESLGRLPKPVFTLYEQTALNMSHGYSMISHNAQAVVVHVGVGTLNLGGALHNAYRGRAPVLIIAGRSPFSFENELPEGRVYQNQWDQELFDQSGSVREYTKWEYELKSTVNLNHVVFRALQVANSEPKGPVYLILPRELLAEKWQNRQLAIQPSSRWRAPSPPEADTYVLEKMVNILLEAQNPLIVTEYVGRNEEAVANLVELSELMGLPVLESQRKRMNFPTRHSLYIPSTSFSQSESFQSADVLLVIDADVPWIPSKDKIREDAKVLQIDVDPLKSGFPLWGFPIDIGSYGSSLLSLKTILDLVRKKKSDALNTKKSTILERRAKIEEKHNYINKKLETFLEQSINAKSMKVESVVACVDRIKSDYSVLMSEAVSNSKKVENFSNLTYPGTFFVQGGGSLGDGVGNALGIKLACPDQDVVCLISDGSFVYSNPVASLWTASKHKIPVLFIILDNGGYASMKGSVDQLYPNGWSRTHGSYQGVYINPEIDYVEVAKSVDIPAWKVERSSDLEDTLINALAQTRTGTSALIDAIIEPA